MRDALHRIVGGKKQLLPISAETFIWALQCACQVHRVPFSDEMALSRFPPPYNSAKLQHALHELGLKGRWRKIQEADIEHLAFPCFVALDAEEGTPHGLALLAKVESGKTLSFEPGSQEPRHLPLTEFMARCAGHGPAICPCRLKWGQGR